MFGARIRVRERIFARTEQNRECFRPDFPASVRRAALRIFGQFGGQIVPHSPSARSNTEDNPRGLLRYHVGPYVLTGRMP